MDVAGESHDTSIFSRTAGEAKGFENNVLESHERYGTYLQEHSRVWYKTSLSVLVLGVSRHAIFNPVGNLNHFTRGSGS
jgi:hypothetical protein